MNNTYQIYLISDSTGETLERIFLALKAQFKNIEYKIHTYSFTRTENQILKILDSDQGSIVSRIRSEQSKMYRPLKFWAKYIQTILKLLKTSRRFTTFIREDGKTELRFGPD